MCGAVRNFTGRLNEGNTFNDEEKAWLGKCNVNGYVEGYKLRSIC